MNTLVENLASIIFLVAVGFFVAGLLQLNCDEQKEWKKRREAKKK